jgi:molybdate/tungstate transport system substrate-binding protein
MNSWHVIPVTLLLIFLFLAVGCTEKKEEPQKLKVLAAGSLLSSFREVETEFEASHPGVDVEIEGHGSIQVIRQVTDLHRQFDVVAVADESLIPDLMYRENPETGENFTDWVLPFARNEMVLAYTGKSLYSKEITPENWPDILSRPDVRVGISNPMLDAAGYRALMLFWLAEDEYCRPDLFETIIGDHFSPTLNVSISGRNSTIELPEIMRPSDGKLAIRDGSIYLISLLEAGGIDYAVEYRSVADDMGLIWVPLSRSINLGSDKYESNYERVRVVLGFQRFSSIGRERIGRPVIYAMTIPSDAKNPDLAREFITYVHEQSGLGRPGWPAPLGSEK